MNDLEQLVGGAQERQLPAVPEVKTLPPILQGHATPAIGARVQSFYLSVADIFERWVTRRNSQHTQRAYRADVMHFVEFAGISWPRDSWRMLTVSITEVLRYRDFLQELGQAPKTINRKVSSLSSFYKYLGAAAAELRLPITVPNPAHSQFIARASTDPVEETRSLSATRARQLMGLPSGDTVLDYRDRALLKMLVYTGVRIGTAQRMNISDFHQDGDESTLRINEKGNKRRTIGIHFQAADAIRAYIEHAGISRGPLFRARLNSRSKKLGERRISATSIYAGVRHYLEQVPGAIKEHRTSEGQTERSCIYTPHSLRATTATLLLDAGVDIMKVKELLGHRHVTTTQIYDKRRRAVSESASHDVPI